MARKPLSADKPPVGMAGGVCLRCLRWHAPPACERDWWAPCVRCGGARGPGSEAGEDVCATCYVATLKPDGTFQRVMAGVRQCAAP